MANPKHKSVIYPSQNNHNKRYQPKSGAYDVYIPGANTQKKMWDKDEIKKLLKDLNVNPQGQGSFRYSPSGDIVFRSSNIADINTAAETGIGWHTEAYRTKKDGTLINKGVPNLTIGKKAYVIPTFGEIQANPNDGVYPVVIFDITDTAQKP